MKGIKELFEEILSLSDKMRPEYLASLGKGYSKDEITNILLPFVGDEEDIPQSFFEIYSRVSGTPHGIKEQNLMDFTPGYRLILLSELPKEIKKLDKRSDLLIKMCNGNLIPLLGNYSSDYLCILKNTKTQSEEIYDVLHDDEPVLIHKNVPTFLTFVMTCYREGIYFLDKDSYLDYDMDKEWEIGRSLNPGIDFWNEG